MKLIWVHHDCLHRQSPAFRANPDSPSIFVWDDAQLKRAGWTLKRIGFIYECLLDLPVVIRRGDPVAEVQSFMEETNCSSVVTMKTPDPHLSRQAAALSAEVLEPQPFVELKGRVDLRRFSRYWTKAEKALLDT